MNVRNKLLLALPVLAALATEGSARADGTPSPDVARADALFQEGKKLLEQGAFDAACSRLAQSDVLDPTISTVGLLATCHEQAGRTATAWREYLDAASRAGAPGDPRADFARQRVAALEPELPKLLVQLDHPGAEVEVTSNLTPIAADKLGVEVPVDPGAYEIVARAPKRQTYRITVTAKPHALVTVHIPELALEGAPPPAPQDAGVTPRGAPTAPPAPVVAPVAPVVKVAPAEPLAVPEPKNPRLPVALFAGGVGLVGVGIGAAFGASAISKNLQSATIYATCKEPGATSSACATGSALREGAFSAATISTIGFGVGLAGLGVSAALLLFPTHRTSASSPSALQVTPLVGREGGGAVLLGHF